MNRSIAAAISLAGAALAGNVFADDITIDPVPFASTRTRADVLNELKTPGTNYWSSQYNMFRTKSSKPRQEVVNEYKASRSEVAALTGEDSGSFYLSHRAKFRPGTTAMGAPAK